MIQNKKLFTHFKLKFEISRDISNFIRVPKMILTIKSNKITLFKLIQTFFKHTQEKSLPIICIIIDEFVIFDYFSNLTTTLIDDSLYMIVLCIRPNVYVQTDSQKCEGEHAVSPLTIIRTISFLKTLENSRTTK